MKLNLLIGVGHHYMPPSKISPRRGEGPSPGTVVKPPWGPPGVDYEPEIGDPNIRTHRRSGEKHPGDPREKLDSTRGITHEYMHSYLVNSSADQYVPKTPEVTANPDVSGYTTRVCRTPPRNTNAGDESFANVMQELKCKR
jgi:hypothetical protein